MRSPLKRSLGALAFLASLVPGVRSQAAPQAPERLTVWFLGDRGHHQPAARAAEVHAALAARGMVLFYREDLELLTPETLAQADALVVYANHDLLGADGRGARGATECRCQHTRWCGGKRRSRWWRAGGCAGGVVGVMWRRRGVAGNAGDGDAGRRATAGGVH